MLRAGQDGQATKNYYVKESVGIACGLFVAALQNMGLATLTHTPSPMGFLSKILDRPSNEKPYTQNLKPSMGGDTVKSVRLF